MKKQIFTESQIQILKNFKNYSDSVYACIQSFISPELSCKFEKIKTIKINNDFSFKEADNLYCEILGLFEYNLDFLNPSILEDFENYKQQYLDILAPHHKEEQDLFDKKSNFFNKISEQNKFLSIWSIYEAPINSNFEKRHYPQKMKSLSYPGRGGKDVKHVFSEKEPVKVTWLKLWEISDSLIQASGDLHHIFIEGFHEKDKKGNFKLSTGS